MAKKKHRIHPQGSGYIRNAVPSPEDIAGFMAPRTTENGLSVANVFGDAGDWVDPFITAAVEKERGLRDVSDDELALLAMLGSVPFLGAGAAKASKLVNRLVPNPKGGFVVREGYKFTKPSQEEATKKLAEAWTRESEGIGKIARPQSVPDELPIYTNSKANQYNDDPFRFGMPISKTYIDPATGKVVRADAAKLDAILPEHATEAAYVRHQKSPYDDRLKNVQHALEADPSVKKDFRRSYNQAGWEDQLKDTEGNWINRTARARTNAWNQLERQMPGYKEAAMRPDPKATSSEYLSRISYDPLDDVDYVIENMKELKYEAKQIDDAIARARSGKSPSEAKYLDKLLEHQKKLHDAISRGENKLLDWSIDLLP